MSIVEINTFSHYFISPEGGFLVIPLKLPKMVTFGGIFSGRREKTSRRRVPAAGGNQSSLMGSSVTTSLVSRPCSCSHLTVCTESAKTEKLAPVE